MVPEHSEKIAAERGQPVLLWFIVGMAVLVVSILLFRYFTAEFWNYTQWGFVSGNPKMVAMADAELQQAFHGKAVTVAKQFTSDPALQEKLARYFSVKITRREHSRVEFELKEQIRYRRHLTGSLGTQWMQDRKDMPFSPEELRIYLVEIYAQLDPDGKEFYQSFDGAEELRKRLLTEKRK